LTVVGHPNIEIEEVIFYFRKQADEEGKIVEETERRVSGKLFYNIQITPLSIPNQLAR